MSVDLKFVELIKAGQVVAFPTETVYGLGADAWNPSAIQKVFSTKGRPSDNPLIVHISDKDEVTEFSRDIPEIALKLMNAFWPGSLSIILKKKKTVLDSVTAGLDTVALRMPDHPQALKFISNTGPLVAPSANTSGKPSPTKAEHIWEDFGRDFPVIDGGNTNIGLESTVIDLSEDHPTILRPGSISKLEIENVLGIEIKESFMKNSSTPKSPGQKYSHYKPKAEVRWLTQADNLKGPSSLFLLLQSDLEAPNIINYNNDIEKLARQLYDRFRQADIEGYTSVVIDSIQKTNHTIVPALLNRIEKAIG